MLNHTDEQVELSARCAMFICRAIICFVGMTLLGFCNGGLVEGSDLKVVVRVKEPMICDKGSIFHECVVLKPGFQFDVLFGFLDVNLCLEITSHIRV